MWKVRKILKFHLNKFSKLAMFLLLLWVDDIGNFLRVLVQCAKKLVVGQKKEPSNVHAAILYIEKNINTHIYLYI